MANTANGVQDAGVGVLNLPALAYNHTAYYLGGGTVPYIPSPDWSRGMITDEGDTAHGVSKFLGGNGAVFLATGPLAGLAGRSSIAAEEAASFFDGTHYTSKVLSRMQKGAGEFHSFPDIVRNFESFGTVGSVTGGDGIVRPILRIPGSYMNSKGKVAEGVFEFMKESNGAINHRYFNPNR